MAHSAPSCPRSNPGGTPIDEVERLGNLFGVETEIQSIGYRPAVRAEFEDSALLKAFGQAGIGAFAVPTAVESEVCKQYGVRPVGVPEAKERFYAISAERKLKHPAVVAISDAARHKLFE